MDSHSKGIIGENHACSFIQKEGFIVIERNYRKKWGEIDIIAQKEGQLHFFEVKSLRVTSLDAIDRVYRPEENVHGLKVRNIRRMIETYLFEKNAGVEQSFSFHVLCVFCEMGTGEVSVKWIQDVIL
jgi:putative endonuclease